MAEAFLYYNKQNGIIEKLCTSTAIHPWKLITHIYGIDLLWIIVAEKLEQWRSNQIA